MLAFKLGAEEMAICLIFIWAICAQGNLSQIELVVVQPQNLASRRAFLLTSPTVQDRLALSNLQRADVESLRRKLLEEMAAGGLKLNGNIELNDGAFKLTFDENDIGVAEILDSRQLRALGQIQLQGLGPMALFRLGVVSRHLGITNEQIKAVDRQIGESQADLAQKLITAKGKERTTLLEDAARRSKLDPLSVLTNDQRSRARELLGEEHPTSKIASELRQLWRKNRVPNPSPIQSVMGDFMEPFRLLFVDELLQHLEVTDQQRSKLIELVMSERDDCARLSEELRDRIKMAEGDVRRQRAMTRSARVNKCWSEVGSILTVQQLKRFREVWLQVRGYNELFSTTETSRKLGVTSAQRDRAGEIMKEGIRERELGKLSDRSTLDKMGDVLTVNQKAEFRKLQGEPISENLLMSLKAARNMALSDPYGIPEFGIGAKP